MNKTRDLVVKINKYVLSMMKVTHVVSIIPHISLVLYIQGVLLLIKADTL